MYVLLDCPNYYPSGFNDLAGVYDTLAEAQSQPIKHDWQHILNVYTKEIWYRHSRETEWVHKE